MLKAAQPMGEIDLGAMLEMCEDMCGQYTGSDFGFEQKALGSIERMVNYAVRTLMVVALLIGSCLLCTIPVGAMETTPFLVAFPIVGSIGYVVSIFFAWRLYKSMKKD